MGLDWLGDYFVLVDSILEVRLILKTIILYLCHFSLFAQLLFNY